MSETYYRYKTIYAAPQFPEWSTTWPGLDGCTARVLSRAPYLPQQPASPGPALQYTPEATVNTWSGPHCSGKTNGIPPYRYTPYNKGRRVKKEYLVTTHFGTNGVNYWKQYGVVRKVNGINCTPEESKRVASGPVYSLYDEQTRDFAGLSTYERSYFDEGEIQAAFVEVRNEVMASAATSYDVLTDISQMQDIPRTVTQVANDLYKILRSLKSRHSIGVLRRALTMTPRELSKMLHKPFRALGDEWLNYRYGIMPLIYSYHDILKTVHRGQDVTSRAVRTISPTNTGATMPPGSSSYKISEATGSIVIRGSIFQFFKNEDIARISGLGINPFVTAWELIPYSFVFDWFINVGSYIAASTNQVWSSKQWACLSRRDNYSIRTLVHLPSNNKTYTISNVLPTNWWGAAPPANDPVIIKNPEGEHILEEVVTDSYWREPIPFTGVVPVFRPSLTWRRLVDGSILSLNQLGRALKALH
mgnify:CR=1 FL=1